jgi:hypothetical protein
MHAVELQKRKYFPDRIHRTSEIASSVRRRAAIQGHAMHLLRAQCGDCRGLQQKPPPVDYFSREKTGAAQISAKRLAKHMRPRLLAYDQTG